MAVVGSIGCGGNVGLQRQDSSNLFNFHNPNARPCLMVSYPQSWKPRSSKILASPSCLQPLLKLEQKKQNALLHPLSKQAQKKQNALLYDQVDKWMRDSVAEIVKRLPESPLLVHVYSGNDKTEIRTEKAEEDNWVVVKQKWENEEIPMPDGLIFVEQIEEEEEEGGGGGGGTTQSEKEQNEEASRAWGIVVQGKGCGPPVCYLLKTSKVGSGIGLWCTHFCLMKVQSFRETAFSQFKNCWLLQGFNLTL